ncbi:MAG: hypothetical protein WBG32_14535 [Nodosilinea sp.]
MVGAEAEDSDRADVDPLEAVWLAAIAEAACARSLNPRVNTKTSVRASPSSSGPVH